MRDYTSFKAFAIDIIMAFLQAETRNSNLMYCRDFSNSEDHLVVSGGMREIPALTRLLEQIIPNLSGEDSSLLQTQGVNRKLLLCEDKEVVAFSTESTSVTINLNLLAKIYFENLFEEFK